MLLSYKGTYQDYPEYLIKVKLVNKNINKKAELC